jgi:hypothetical protein
MKNFMMWVVMPGLIVGMTYKMGYDSGRMSATVVQKKALADAPPFQGDSQQVHPPVKRPVPPVQSVQSVPRNNPAEVQMPQRLQGGTRVRQDGSVYRPAPAVQPKLAPMTPLSSDYRGGQSVRPAASAAAFQQQQPVQVPCSDCEKKRQLEQQRKLQQGQ